MALQKKSTRFAKELCVYHQGAVLDIEDVLSAELWYQVTDLQRIKRKAMVQANEAGQYGLGSLLTNTYGKTDTDTMEAIVTWVASCAARRGLERFLNKEYAAKRCDIRRRTIKSVLTAQRKMLEEGIKDNEYTTQVLGRLSVAFSQDSSRFAHVMGVADRAAAVALEGECVVPPVRDEEPRKCVIRTYSPNTVLEVPSSASLTSSQSSSYPMLTQHRNYSVANTPPRSASEMRHYY